MATRNLMIQPEVLSDRRNRLLDSLAEEDAARLSPHLTYVELEGGRCVSSLSKDHAVVCFPLTLVASMVQVTAGGSRFEVGLIGSEGMIGWATILGDPGIAETGIVQVGGGAALTAPAALVAQLCRTSETFRAAMLSFVQSLTVQMSHTIVANLRDGIEPRLARWLLMLHDRVDGDMLPVTHGELAATLHVRRASVTDTLHILEGDLVVRCTRGHVLIRDRAALMAIAGDSYGPAEASYRALIGDFGKR